MTSGDAGFGEIARAMAEALRAGAGATAIGATPQLRHTGGAVSCRAWSDAREHLSVDYVPIAMLLREHPPSALEVRLDAEGYVFTARPDVASVSPGRLVFDPEFRYPGHPRPGLPRPAAAEPSGAPTDPAVRAEVTRLTTEFADVYTAVKGDPPPWPPGRTEADLAAAEARIGVRLPEDLRALYLVADGDPRESGLLGPYSHDPLGELVERYLDGEPGSHGWEDEPDDTGVVFETPPFGHVKRLSRNDWWVTFGSDRSGNYLAADLDPAERGRPGQVLEYGLIPETGLREDPVRSYSEVLSHPAEVAGLPGRELVQEVYLNDAGDVDLAAFEPLESVRALSVNRAGTVHPAIGGLGVLESLRIDAHRVDLAPIAGHPALWDLALTDVGTPLDLTVLRTLPRLTRLSLERSAVPDWGPVCELPGLRVLKLDRSQVPALLTSGNPLPRLAALFVSGRTTLREMSELRAAFGAPEGVVTEIRGVLP